MRQLLVLRVIVEDAVVVELGPVVLLFINIQSVDASTRHAQLGQFLLYVTVELLSDGVEDRETHAVLQPELAIVALVDLVDVVVVHGRGVQAVGIEGFNTVAVVAVQSVRRTNPNEAA